MNEKSIFGDIVKDVDISEIDYLANDPSISKIFNKVRDYNELLLTMDVTELELAEIIEYLDQEWAPMIGSNLIATGKMTFPISKTENINSSSESDVETAYYREQAIGTRGFSAYKINASFDDEVVGTDIYKIVLSVQRDVADGEAHDDGVIGYWGSADVDELIVSTDTMSLARAKAWFAYFHPEFMEEIDERLLNGSGDEGAATLRLKDMSIQLVDNAMRSSSRRAISMYINEMLQCDTDSPYKCSIEGGCTIIDDEGDRCEVFFNKNVFLANIDHVSMECVTDDDVFEPYVSLTVITPDRTITGVSMMIPVKNVSEIVSIRSDFYGVA